MRSGRVRQALLDGFVRESTLPCVGEEKLPTNSTANRHQIHRWFNFVAGFSPEFVVKHSPDRNGSLVLDPFVGCGTTLVVAQRLGHRSIGFEPHPFFARIASAKIDSSVTLGRLDCIEAVLLAGLRNPLEIGTLAPAAEEYLLKLFKRETLEQLLGARQALVSNGLEDDDTAFLFLSRVVDMCCGSKVDGIYRAPTSRKTATVPSVAIPHVAEEIRVDLEYQSLLGRRPKALLYRSSSECMRAVKSRSVDAVITSPPYLNNFDFAEMTRMQLYFWGICGSWREISERVRSKLIVNTTTALAGHRDRQEEYRFEIVSSVRTDLDCIVTRLDAQRKVRRGRKEYHFMVYPYFAQMQRILRECFRCMGSGSRIDIVIGDAALYGIHVSTPQLLGAIMAEVGFRHIALDKLRSRGTRWKLSKRDGSPVGLGEYNLSAIRDI